MNVITLKWKGEEYTLNENEAFRAGEAVEDVLTLGELTVMANDLSTVKFRKLARAYSAMLSVAGAHAPPKEILDEFNAAIINAKDAEKLALANTAIVTLVGVLMDGAPMDQSSGDDDGKKPETLAS